MVLSTHLKLLERVVSGVSHLSGVCLSVTLFIVDLWQSCVCCIRSGVTQCAIFMVLYMCRMCQCRLHAVLWSHIGILMGLLPTEPRSTAGPELSLGVLVVRSCRPCIRWCGTGGFQEQCLLIYWPKMHCKFFVFYYVSLSLLSVYWLVLWGWNN